MRLPDGFRAGHWTDLDAATGCTVMLAPPGTISAGEVRGGGPGTRESDLLAPSTHTAGAQAVVFTGGSAFGLAACDGVVAWMEEQGLGYATPGGLVPLVFGAVVYDLMVGSAAVRPDAAAGRAACEALSDELATGRVGAGTGCSAGKLLGPGHLTRTGVGAASLETADGATLVAVAAANPVGDIVAADGTVLAGVGAIDLLRSGRVAAPPARANTTLACVMTDAVLTKTEVWLLARAAGAGIHHAVRPSGTHFDGDLTVCMASQRVPADTFALSALAAEVVAEAIRDAARS
jgi:L-aminopeptidase/D-esterase-like protein